jgi:hypothetical protein
MNTTEDYIKEIEEHDRKEAEKNKKIINEAKKYLNEKQIEELELAFDETYNHSFEIVNYKKGDLDDDYEEIKLYVNQTTNGGYTGDEFAGEQYVKLAHKKYLMWYYSC